MREPPATLGDVLYAKSKAPVSEQVWSTLVQSIAEGDPLALHRLYEMAHCLVFTLMMRITANRETAEEGTVNVFHDIWRRASSYDPAKGTVLGWIMNQAHSQSNDFLLFRSQYPPSHGGDMQPLAKVTANIPVLRPTIKLQGRLAFRIAEETGNLLVLPSTQPWAEPEWEQVAPGIECMLLATDMERHRVSMLVRLAPGTSYPAHTHADVEELYLLDGELWIDERKLFQGHYNYGAPRASDDRVWSETGCTCVLMTSTEDTLR